MRFKREAEMLKALAHPTRLEILTLLADKELCVCEILESLSLPQPIVSQHLAVLRYSGVVDSEKRGLRIYYRLKNKKFAHLIDTLKQIVSEEIEAQREYLLKREKLK